MGSPGAGGRAAGGHADTPERAQNEYGALPAEATPPAEAQVDPHLADAPPSHAPALRDGARHVSLWELFVIFFKSSLAFGGGLGIVNIMEQELVQQRKLVTREEFLTIYAMGRITPSGTMTALAVAYGYRFRGWAGTVVALGALVLPCFVLTVILTAAYQLLAGGPFLTVLPVTVLPAALALIVTAAVRLGQDVYRQPLPLLLALVGFGAVAFLGVNSSVMLLLGALTGVLLLRPPLKSAEGSAGTEAHAAHVSATGAARAPAAADAAPGGSR